MNSNSLSRAIACQLAAIAYRSQITTLPASVVHAATRCVIDWTAVTLAGSTHPVALALEHALADELGHGKSRTLSGLCAPMRTAAMINGLASHIVEFDDIYAPGTYHPGSPTIAAALAAATGEGVSGECLLRAVIAGYEVSNRVARTLGTPHYRYWHTTGTAGAIGAAAAVATIYQLDESQMAHALATSCTMAAGLQGAFRGGSEIKPLHAGHAADSGFVAAGLAREGVVAAEDLFEGESGMAAAMAGAVDWQSGIGDSGEYTITRMTVKNHGCCGHIFPALDGVLWLAEEHGFAADDVVSIGVGGYSATVDVTGNHLADTAAAARFCLPFVVASGLVHGSIRLDAFSQARLNDARVQSLMTKIHVGLDPEIDALFPQQRAANVTIELANGMCLHRFQPHRVGDPDLPLDDRALDAKFLELTEGVLAVDQAAGLLAALWHLQEQPGVALFYPT